MSAASRPVTRLASNSTITFNRFCSFTVSVTPLLSME
jgi:hypothetical protein